MFKKHLQLTGLMAVFFNGRPSAGGRVHCADQFAV
jgi:hypothetical protein